MLFGCGNDVWDAGRFLRFLLVFAFEVCPNSPSMFMRAGLGSQGMDTDGWWNQSLRYFIWDLVGDGTQISANQLIAFFTMAFKSSLVLVLYAIHAGAAKTTLSAELTNLLPICAHTCFTSFLDFNFALTKCGINPTLDCLCTTKSVSEYTVGEGAVQCVLSTAACTQGGAPGRLDFGVISFKTDGI